MTNLAEEIAESVILAEKDSTILGEKLSHIEFRRDLIPFAIRALECIKLLVIGPRMSSENPTDEELANDDEYFDYVCLPDAYSKAIHAGEVDISSQIRNRANVIRTMGCPGVIMPDILVNLHSASKRQYFEETMRFHEEFLIANGITNPSVCLDYIRKRERELRKIQIGGAYVEPPMNPRDQCASCNSFGRVISNGRMKPLLECSICRNIKYCSKVCQKIDWTRHKEPCKCVVTANFPQSSNKLIVRT